jgi:AcrR family transcriptional regulator
MAPNGKMGRPRGFAEKEALEAAMRVFWEKGYEGSTLGDLTEAMGINRSSMYATFGDKEALFRLVIARYAEGPASYVREALEQPTVRAVVEALLRGALELLTDPSHPRGCLSVQGALACGSNAEPMKQAMIEWRKQGESDIQKRLQRARREGDLAKDVDPGDLARYISTVLTGLGVQAANGATRAQMTRLVDMVLRSMPF